MVQSGGEERSKSRVGAQDRMRERQGQCVTRDLDGNPISQSLLPARVKSQRGRTYNIDRRVELAGKGFR
jgi:hypothetical protein